MFRTQGWRRPAGAIYVGRPTQWGNRWRVGGKAHGAMDPATAVARYERALLNAELRNRDGDALVDTLHELRGRDLLVRPGQALSCRCAPVPRQQVSLPLGYPCGDGSRSRDRESVLGDQLLVFDRLARALPVLAGLPLRV